MESDLAQGQLFTRDFLETGIREQPAYQAIDDESLQRFDAEARKCLGRLLPDQGMNETNTEDKVIKPVITALGWGPNYLAQMAAARKGRSDVPDSQLCCCQGELSDRREALLSWLHHEFDIVKPNAALQVAENLSSDTFIAAVRKSLPKSRKKISTTEVARLTQEFRDWSEPVRKAAESALSLECRLSDLVNAAYGMTAADVQLMWDTAPPRMPIVAESERKHSSR